MQSTRPERQSRSRREDPGDPELRTPLQRLIWDHRQRTGETFADIARRAGVPRQTISQIANNPDPRRTPRPATLDALALGLGVSRELVETLADEVAAQVAEAERAEAPTPYLSRVSDPDLVVLLGIAEALSPEGRRVLLATAHALGELLPQPTIARKRKR